jgi:hypothetical protein
MKNPRIREGTPMEQARHEAMNVLNTRQFHCGLEVMNQNGFADICDDNYKCEISKTPLFNQFKFTGFCYNRLLEM